MNAKQWISSQCSVLFEETTLKAVWVQNSFFKFHCGGVDDGGLSAGNNGNTTKATFTALTMAAPETAPSTCSASLQEEGFQIFTRHYFRR